MARVITPSFQVPSYTLVVLEGFRGILHSGVLRGATALPIITARAAELQQVLGTAHTFVRVASCAGIEDVHVWMDGGAVKCEPLQYSHGAGAFVEASDNPLAMYCLLKQAIQQGAKGDKGDKGDAGASGSNGAANAMHVLLSNNSNGAVVRGARYLPESALIKFNNITGADATAAGVTLPAGTYLLTGDTKAKLTLAVSGGGSLPDGLNPVASTVTSVKVGSGNFSIVDTFSSFGAMALPSGSGDFQDSNTLHGVVTLPAGGGVIKVEAKPDWTVQDPPLEAAMAFYTSLTIVTLIKPVV